MAEERYVPTEQDLRGNAIFNAERLVTEQMRMGMHFPDPVKQMIEYAEAINAYIKTGETK